MSGHLEKIKCPECGTVQTACVKHLVPFADYTHECEKCGYWIQESEWDVVEEEKN